MHLDSMRKGTFAKSRGFTLIELLVVIAIIGILASIILASLASARGKAINAQRLSDMKEVQKALELYYNDNNHYPISVSFGSLCAAWAANDILGSTLVPKYIAIEPADPQMIAASNKNCYLYKTDAKGLNYKFMVYNIVSNPDISSQPNFIDPAANKDTYWTGPTGANPSPCDNGSTLPRAAQGWAIWTSDVSRCY